MKKELICIRCPIGCMITVTGESKDTLDIAGNTCKRGEEYARAEMTAPMRTVTSTVRVIGGRGGVVSVKTQTDIPKEKMFSCMKELKRITVQAPIHIGDVIIENTAGTETAVIATGNMEAALPSGDRMKG